MEKVRKVQLRRQSEAGTATKSSKQQGAAQPAGLEEPREGSVQVISGASVQSLPLAGLAVAQARQLATTILNVDPRSPALVNGVPVEPEYRLANGDQLEFVHHAGEKG
jgi:hypothetical protein